MPDYQIIMHAVTEQAIRDYTRDLKTGKIRPGDRLVKRLQESDFSELNEKVVLDALLRSKKPRIFAEREVAGNHSDWTRRELAILGGINIAMCVNVYDNGAHSNPLVHTEPFQATLVFVAGALLAHAGPQEAIDWHVVTTDNRLDFNKYFKLYEERLLPALLHINALAAGRKRPGLVTIPGIGCGQFAGPFQGELAESLRNVLLDLIGMYKSGLQYIRAIYFDPYLECNNERMECEHISFLVRPLRQGNDGKSQLSQPSRLEDQAGEFANCDLYSIVAWDHASWPGNDFYVGHRMTDDGVKAAATDCMYKTTGIIGSYNPITNQYEPPGEFQVWQQLIEAYGLQLELPQDVFLYGEQSL